MKKLLLSLLLLCAGTIRADTGDVRVIIVQSNGSYNEYPVTFVANGLLAFGSTPGTIVTVTNANYATTASLSSYATVASLSAYVTTSSLNSTLSAYASVASVPILKAGHVAFPVSTQTKTITFTTNMASANYEVIVQPNGLATSGWATSQTTSGFVLTLSVATAAAGNVSWFVVPDQN